MSKSHDGFGIYGRSHEFLHDLPVKYRWEFTRRHPYYLSCWELAKAYRHSTASDDPQLKTLRHWAFLMLGYIGVTGEPVDPTTPFEDLDADVEVDPGFSSRRCAANDLQSDCGKRNCCFAAGRA